MAMMSGPNDWLHFYHPQNLNFSGGGQGEYQSHQVQPSSTVSVTTTTVSAPSPPPQGTLLKFMPSSTVTESAVTPTQTQTQTQLSPEGRVSKAIRRRSRASRRTPTTLLNTDATNFRAMVQQFTGGPSASPFQFAPTTPGAYASSGLPNLGFGLASRPLHGIVNPISGLMAAPSGSGYHPRQQQQLYQQQQNQRYIYSSSGGGGNTEGGNNTFVEGVMSDPRLPNPNVAADDGGLLMDHGGGFFFPSSTSP